MNSIIIIREKRSDLDRQNARFQVNSFTSKLSSNRFYNTWNSTYKITSGFIIGFILDTVIPCTFGLIMIGMRNLGRTLFTFQLKKCYGRRIEKILKLIEA